MYNILRIFIVIIVLTMYFLLIRKKLNVITISISLIIGFSLYIILCIVPFERNFIGFNSIEDTIEYQYSKTIKENEPIYIRKGEKSALVKLEGTTIPYLFEVENGKWRMHKDKNIIQKAIPEWGYTIVKIESKSENKSYIVLINGLKENEIKEQEILDNCNSKFETMRYEVINKEMSGVIFYTMIENNIENYKLYVNGKTIIF